MSIQCTFSLFKKRSNTLPNNFVTRKAANDNALFVTAFISVV